MREFEKHLFISYAHIDNQPLTPEQQGWITRFHGSLGAMLSMRMGRKAEIWRDVKLTGNDIFGDEIVAQFPKTALLVSVLSPRYLKSDWCTREVREFCKVAQESGGVVVENKSRVIKVIKTPVESEDPLPDFMRGMKGYPFYTVDEDQTPLELDPAYGPGFAQQYNVNIAKLAHNLAQMLQQLEQAGKPGPAAGQSVNEKPTVYLSECSSDRRQDREALDGELRRLGYPILPEGSLPRDEAEYVAEVTRLLEKCKLSIHLIGSTSGAAPDGPSQKSGVALQNELAIQRCKTGSLRRLIWLRAGTASTNAAQQRLIDSLHHDAETQFGADLITEEIEPFKSAMHATLARLQAPEAPKVNLESGSQPRKLVYLICDERDRQATLPARKFLKARGHEAKTPIFEGRAAEVREAHEELMASCDAVLLFYGAGDEGWKRTVDKDLEKINAYREGKRLLASYTYLAAPASNAKQDLVELEEPNLINGLAGFSESTMTPFLEALQKG